MRQTTIGFKSQGVALEGVIATPQGLASPFPAAVLCHPHPAFGGSMESTVIMALARALDGAGIATLRFNFRGVGGSQGTFSKGEKEQQDLRVALDLLRKWPGINPKRIALVGFSFGSQVILQGLSEMKRASVLALISPPISSFVGSPVGGDRRPKLFLVGGNDRLVRANAFQEQVAALPVPGRMEIVADADHSWRGHEEAVALRVAQFLAEAL